MAKNIIAVANHKGGVGKTTAVANIGATLARKGYDTLLVDIDPQGNLTSTFMNEPQRENTIAEAIMEGSAPVPLKLRKNLSIIPSTIDTANVEIVFATSEGREAMLKNVLTPIEANYDIILIDTPPSLGLLTINALCYATDLLIPLTAEVYSLKGLSALNNIIQGIQQGLNTKLKLSGIILSNYSGRNVNKLVEETLRQNYQDKVLQTKIRPNIAIVEALLESTDVYSYDKRCNGAKDYEALTSEIIKNVLQAQDTHNAQQAHKT